VNIIHKSEEYTLLLTILSSVVIKKDAVYFSLSYGMELAMFEDDGTGGGQMKTITVVYHFGSSNILIDSMVITYHHSMQVLDAHMGEFDEDIDLDEMYAAHAASLPLARHDNPGEEEPDQEQQDTQHDVKIEEDSEIAENIQSEPTSYLDENVEIEYTDGNEASFVHMRRKNTKNCNCQVYFPIIKEEIQMCIDAYKKEYAKKYKNRTKKHEPSEPVKLIDEIIRRRFFDPFCNYRYCHPHIVQEFNFSERRLAKNRKILRNERQSHGLISKPSNNALKKETIDRLFTFIDTNSQANGRQKGKTHYIDASFTRFYLPSKNLIEHPTKPWSEAKLKRCFLYVFNRQQTEMQGQTISNGTLFALLRTERFKKYAIFPHKSDYCGTCDELKLKIRQCIAILNRADTVQGQDRVNYEVKKEKLVQELQEHRAEAQKEKDYYKQAAEKCKVDYNEIQDTMATDDKSELQQLKQSFTCVIAADYQQGKSCPGWYVSPQAGETYFFRKFNYDVFGIVNFCTHRDTNDKIAKPTKILAPLEERSYEIPAGSSLHCPSESTIYINEDTIYINDERQGGSKSANHTISHLDRYIKQVCSKWIQHLVIYMDNAGTNKNSAVIAWACEIVKFTHIKSIRISFMVPGHTKFAPDTLFSQVARTYYNNDIMITDDIVKCIIPYAQCRIVTSHNIGWWKAELETKYKKLPQVKSYCDFLIEKDSNNSVNLYAKAHCYEGEWTDVTSSFFIKNKEDEDKRVSLVTHSYHVMQKTNPLSAEKLVDLAKCAAHIPEEHKWFYLALKEENKQYSKQLPVVCLENENVQPNESQLTPVEKELIKIKHKTFILSKSKTEYEAYLKEVGANEAELIPNDFNKNLKNRKTALWNLVDNLQKKQKQGAVVESQMREQFIKHVQEMQPFQWANVGPIHHIT